MILKEAIEDSFNPKNTRKNNDQYDLLVTTDVLAEGINLHRANALINYDLPWNPTRIMQRVGRINRVGTEFDEIYVFNFFPTAQSSKQLPLKDRIIEKLQAFHDTLGEDFKYLSEEEEVSSQKLFNAINADLNTDEESANPELAYLAVIRQIRDNDVALFEKIKKLPKKAKTGRYSSKIVEEGTVSFIRKGFLKTFYITEEANTKQLSFIDAVDYIKCEANEEKIGIGKTYYDHFEANSTAFDDSLVEDEVARIGKVAAGSTDIRLLKLLRAIAASVNTLTDDQEQKLQKIIGLYENGDIPSSDTKKINKAIKGINDPEKIYYTIENLIPDKYFETRREASSKADGVKQVILSCYLRRAK